MKKSQQANQINHNITARHFRANSYVPLLLALRPRAGNVLSVHPILVLSLICMFGLGFSLLGSVIFPTSASAATSITLSLPATPLTLNVTPDSKLHEVQSDDITVTTNAPFGYTLVVKGKSEDNALVNSTTSSRLPSITSTTGLTKAEYDTLDNTNLNTWAFKPSKLGGSDNDKYLPAPTTTPVILDQTATSNNDLANSYNIAIAAKLDTTLPAGQYSNTFIITASANARQYNITYDANGGTNPPANVTGQSTIEAVTIDSQEPTYNEYHKFTGWCDKAPTLFKPNDADNVNWYDTCDGTTYQPSDTWLPDSDNATLTLYAMWQEQYTTFDMAYEKAGKEQQTLDGQTYYKMQDMETNICTSVTMPSDRSTATLIDTRDNNTYTVAKLKDGKCWMTQNLRIGGKQPITLTSDTSDVESSFQLPATGCIFDAFEKACIYIDSRIDYGGYYNWFTATAGEGTLSKKTGDTLHSICSQKWKLPSKGDFNELLQEYPGRQLLDAPPSFVVAGNWFSDGAWHSDAAYLSSSAYEEDPSKTWSTALIINYNDSSPAHIGGVSGNGWSVRCVAR